MSILVCAVLFVVGGVSTWHPAYPESAKRLDDSSVVLDLANAPQEAREACGWYALEDVPPAAPDGSRAVPCGYERTAEGYRRVYRLEPIPPTVRRYSKLKLIVAAKAAGRWTDIKAFVKSADLEDEFQAAQYFEDGNAQFVAGTNAVVTAGLATDAEIKTLLDASVDDEP